MASILAATACTSGADDGGAAAQRRPSELPPHLTEVSLEDVESCVPTDIGGPPDSELPAGLKLTCGTVKATPPAGAQEVSLRVAMLASDKQESPEDGPLTFFLPGGPGVSSLALLTQAVPELDYTKTTLVTWDGSTAGEHPGACGPRGVAFGVADVASTGMDVGPVVDECDAVESALPWRPSAQAGATELDVVRRAFGATQVDLLASSYGTAIAQRFIAGFPANVRRAVLDAPVLPDVEWSTRMQAMTDAASSAWRTLTNACPRSDCSKRFTAALASGATYADVRDRVLAAAPSAGSGKTLLTARVLDRATLTALTSAELWRAYTFAVDSAIEGNGRELYVMGTTPYFSVDQSVYLAALCRDIAPEGKDPGPYQVPDPIANSFATDLLPCAGTTARAESAPAGSPAGVPTLVLASDSDPLTPGGLLDHVDLGEAATICRVRTPGHTVSSRPRGARLVQSFLAGDSDVGC